MATGAECAGAILGIIQFSIQLTKFSLRKCRSYRAARTELESLQQNTSAFSQTLHHFGQTMKEMLDKRLGLAKDAGFESFMLDIRAMVEGRMGVIDRSQRRVKALGDPKVSKLSRLNAKVQWTFFDRRDMNELLASLEPIKSTMTLVVGISNTQLLMEEIAQLQRDNITISEDKIKQLEAYRAQISMLEREVEKKQQQYESMCKLTTSDPNSEVWFIREVVEHVQQLATQRISDSASIMRDIAPDGRASTSTGRGKRSTTKTKASYDPYNHFNRPYPSPPPRQREQVADKSLPRSAPRTVEQDQNNHGVGPPRNPRECVREVQSFSEDVAEVDPAGPAATVWNDSTINQSLTHPASVEGNDTPQEPPSEEIDLSVQILQTPPPLIRSQYRMVINRKGKMVPREWRRAGDDGSSITSSSSSSL